MIEKIFFISDLLFPVWWVILMVILMRRGFRSWKAWGIASTFCVAQAYLVAKYIGWNLGGYFLFLIASIPALILGEIPKEQSFTNQSELSFWLLPPLILIVIPMIILYFTSKKEGK